MDLDYIQCPHCKNKYAVSDKLKAATGKQIRCKHCQKAFEIAIQHDSVRPEAQSKSETAGQSAASSHQAEEASSAFRQPSRPTAPDSDARKPEPQAETSAETRKTAQHKEPSGKKNINIQAVISMVLGVILIAASIGGYLFLNKPELVGVANQPAAKPMISHDLVHPMIADLPRLAARETVHGSPVKKSTATAEQRHESLQACKDASADYWLRTRLLATADLDTKTYMGLLNMNVAQAQEIRILCKKKALIAKLSEAARSNKKPQWIKPEIEARIAITQLPSAALNMDAKQRE